MLLPLKFAAAAAVAGAVLLMLGTALHPLKADPADAAAAFAEYAGDDLWNASHLGQFLGVVLIFIDLVRLSDSLRGQTVEWVTTLGIFFGVAALATAAVLQAVDGVALKVMVDTWAKSEAEQKQIAFQGAMAVRQIEVGRASFSALSFGTVFVLFGSAVALSETYPNWLGWFGLIGGIGTIAGGLTTAAAGFSNTRHDHSDAIQRDSGYLDGSAGSAHVETDGVSDKALWPRAADSTSAKPAAAAGSRGRTCAAVMVAVASRKLQLEGIGAG